MKLTVMSPRIIVKTSCNHNTSLGTERERLSLRREQKWIGNKRDWVSVVLFLFRPKIKSEVEDFWTKHHPYLRRTKIEDYWEVKSFDEIF